MPIGVADCCTSEVYVLRENDEGTIDKVILPDCSAIVDEPKCPPILAKIRFSVDDDFWESDTVDFSCEKVFVDRVCTITNEDGSQIEERRNVFAGYADSPGRIPYISSEFELTFTDDYGIQAACPITKDIQGEFLLPDLLTQIIECMGFEPKIGPLPPVPGYPSTDDLPDTPLILDESSHPAGPLSDPVFAQLFAYCQSQQFIQVQIGTDLMDGAGYLGYQWITGGDVVANPWAASSFYPLQQFNGAGQLISETELITDQYVLYPDGRICHELIVRTESIFAPPFTVQLGVDKSSVTTSTVDIGEFSSTTSIANPQPPPPRCAACFPAKNPYVVERDIRASSCRQAGEELKSLSVEFGFDIRYEQNSDTVCIEFDRGANLPVLFLSTSENLCDANLFPASGNFTDVCLTGVDDAWSFASIPPQSEDYCRKKVKTGNVSVGPTGIAAAASALLAECSNPQDGCEVVLDPSCDRLQIVDAPGPPPIFSEEVQTDPPEVCQLAIVTIQQLDEQGQPCPHPANSTDPEPKPIVRRRYEWNSSGDELIVLTLGPELPTLQSILTDLARRN